MLAWVMTVHCTRAYLEVFYVWVHTVKHLEMRMHTQTCLQTPIVTQSPWPGVTITNPNPTTPP